VRSSQLWFKNGGLYSSPCDLKIEDCTAPIIKWVLLRIRCRVWFCCWCWCTASVCFSYWGYTADTSGDGRLITLCSLVYSLHDWGWWLRVMVWWLRVMIESDGVMTESDGWEWWCDDWEWWLRVMVWWLRVMVRWLRVMAEGDDDMTESDIHRWWCDDWEWWEKVMIESDGGMIESDDWEWWCWLQYFGFGLHFVGFISPTWLRLMALIAVFWIRLTLCWA
jgi:hypothetical protein